MKKPDYCQCADRGCPVHLGSAVCGRIPTGIVYRIDMEDKSGTPMCDRCAEDACNSGVFDWRDFDEREEN